MTELAVSEWIIARPLVRKLQRAVDQAGPGMAPVVLQRALFKAYRDGWLHRAPFMCAWDKYIVYLTGDSLPATIEVQNWRVKVYENLQSETV